MISTSERMPWLSDSTAHFFDTCVTLWDDREHIGQGVLLDEHRVLTARHCALAKDVGSGPDAALAQTPRVHVALDANVAPDLAILRLDTPFRTKHFQRFATRSEVDSATELGARHRHAALIVSYEGQQKHRCAIQAVIMAPPDDPDHLQFIDVLADGPAVRILGDGALRNGDSGCPLYVKSASDTWVLAGIFQHTEREGRKIARGRFTRVDHLNGVI